MEAGVLEEIISVQIFYEFESQGIFLRFLFLLVFDIFNIFDIFVIVLENNLDDQRIRELVNRNELRGEVVSNLPLEAVLGPIIRRLGQLEDPTLNALDGGTRGDCDVILVEGLLRQFYGEEVGPELEVRSNGAKVRPKREIRWFDSEPLHAFNELILRFVCNTSVHCSWDILEEDTALQMR